MKNNKVKVLSLFVAAVLSSQVSAETFNIDSISIDSGTLVRSFNPKDSVKPIVLDFIGNTDLVGGYINKETNGGSGISETNFKQVKDSKEPTQYTYTAASNIQHNLEWTQMAPPADGTLTDPSYVVPTGTIDDEAGTITLDLSSWFANHMMMNQNLGGIATGKYDAATGQFSDLTWSATLTQGMKKGADVTWTLQGSVLSSSPVGMSGSTPSFSNGMLEIPVVDVPDAAGNITRYKASLKLVASGGPLTFEVTGASASSLGANSSNPSFSNGMLNIPTVDVYDASGNFTSYTASMKLTTPTPLTFEVTGASPK